MDEKKVNSTGAKKPTPPPMKAKAPTPPPAKKPTPAPQKNNSNKQPQKKCNKKLLAIASGLPYVRTLHNFRLLNENAMLRRGGIESNQIGGLTEVYFGIFTDPEEGLKPRKRAYAIQEMTGSKADLDAVCRAIGERKD